MCPCESVAEVNHGIVVCFNGSQLIKMSSGVTKCGQPTAPVAAELR